MNNPEQSLYDTVARLSRQVEGLSTKPQIHATNYQHHHSRRLYGSRTYQTRGRGSHLDTLLKWTPDGRPICSRCNTPGHICSACNNNYPSSQARGNSFPPARRGNPIHRSRGRSSRRRGHSSGYRGLVLGTMVGVPIMLMPCSMMA